MGGPPRLLRVALGPSLGQCCGGIVWLVIERIDPPEAAAWQARAATLAAGQALQRRIAEGDPASVWQAIAHPGGNEALLQVRGARWTFTQQIGGDAFPVLIFGAGHVGSATVRALAPLGARITWVDGRDDIFPASLPPGVEAVATVTPTSEVRAAPPGSYFLVMTHSHTLDFSICEAIFERHDFAWFGLIGSASKRTRFEHRLQDRGLSAAKLLRMSCPIGLPGILGKQPGVIAVAVAAQLLAVSENP